MKPQSTEILLKRREIIKNRLELFKRYAEDLEKRDLTNLQMVELDSRIKLATQTFEEFCNVQSEIEIKSNDIEKELTERQTTENIYHSAFSLAQHCLNHQNRQLCTTPSAEPANLCSVQLPTIKLPEFDGNCQNWLEFRDTYTSLIHQNKSISAIQKFHYLRAALRNNAARVVSSIEFSESNYEIAWQSLLDRYNNEDWLVSSHISSLLNLGPLTKPSGEKIKQMVDQISKSLRSLQILGEPVETWDTIIIQIVVRKLDIATIKAWEQFKIERSKPKLDDLKKFLNNRASVLDSVERTDLLKPKMPYSTKSKDAREVYLVNRETCIICKESHKLFHCQQFLTLSPQQRLNKIVQLKICINCLKPNHWSDSCLSGNCRKCQKKHNTLLHGAKFTDISTSLQELNEGPSQNHKEAETQVAAHHSFKEQCHILLPTALVGLLDADGKTHIARALLDSGAQGSFITSAMANKLDLKLDKIQGNITGISNVKTNICGKVTTKIVSLNGNFSSNISCWVLPQITGSIPNNYINKRNVRIPNVPLADPTFNQPGSIDILIGSDLFWNIMKPGLRTTIKGEPALKETVFGWLISGEINAPSGHKLTCNFTKVTDIQHQLQRFWELEELPAGKPISPDEVACENHFEKHMARESDGRFKVMIPFKHPVTLLGDSKDKAKKQFLFLERKLHNNPKLLDYYTEFMREYERLGHMKQVIETKDRNLEYFMPHHGILKEERSTTKLRVVFNASMPTSSGYSLNDLQYKGPTVQDDLISIILRFRKHQIAIAADIKKMYRQVKMDEKDMPFQQIFWRESPHEELKIYRLTTVTYGTTAGSFLATRCLKQLSIEHLDTEPTAAKIIASDFYVDDLITGADSTKHAIEICQKVFKILAKGCFELRKWKSNDSELLQALSANFNEENFELGKDEKTLGLIWSPSTDSLMFNISWVPTSKQDCLTKRIILSQISKIFDPLGLLSPSTLFAKILLQQLWLSKASWDDQLPESIQKTWLAYVTKLPVLNKLQIPRKVIISKAKSVEFHCFSDASQTAYGGCIYVRSEDEEGNTVTTLLCAKGKVAPLKTITIPRLELCGALQVARLANICRKSMRMENIPCTVWTDSTIVLGWLKTPPNRLNTFVSNRVAEIQELTKEFQWRHISSALNPADQLTRGIGPENLQDAQIWWNGPEFLKDHSSKWPNSQLEDLDNLPEVKKCVQAFVTNVSCNFNFENFSSLTRLKRTMAYVLRFKENTLFKKKQNGPLSVNEINNAFQILVKITQSTAYQEEITDLTSGKGLSKRSKLLSLSPFIDQLGILRVGGRLRNSNYDFNKMHPILLPANHHLSKLIFRHQHLALYHAGPSTLLATVRETVWVPAGRNLAKRIVKSCVQCNRYNGKSINPIMGELPSVRVTPGFPFEITGIDFAGPFNLKAHSGRNSKTYKAWICLFVCMKTRAVHLELVSSLSTEHFLSTFRRFVSRRGRPSEVFSDNGSNFVGANRELKQLLKQSNFRETVINSTSSENIKWHFSPPRTPHMGGLWESGVKSCKHHLRRVMGNQTFTFEEFYTILVQIEAILNSRPLTPMSSNPNDLLPLTPAHFLIGRNLTSLPDPELTRLPTNRLSRFQHIQQIQQHFWQRWRKEYMNELQQRTKWKERQRSIKIGDLVLIKEESVPPKSWSLGRIVSLHPGKDGIPRVADIKTSQGIIRRPVIKLCILPLE